MYSNLQIAILTLFVLGSSLYFSACETQPPTKRGGASAEAPAPQDAAPPQEAEAPLQGVGGEEDEAIAGLVVRTSKVSGQETFDAIKAAIEENEALTLMTVVDHAENAKSANLELAPTWVLIFGNPNVGTPLMQNQPTIAIDLPQRILIYERGGETFVAYNDPAWMARRHGLRGEEERLSKVSGLLDKLSKTQAP